jgi:YfiH family protein
MAAEPDLKDFQPVLLRQIHSDTVWLLEERPGAELRGDALITARSLLLLVVKTADCLPIFVIDEEGRSVGAVHCGWRGTVQRILSKVLSRMAGAFGSRLSSLLVVMGPAIQRDCYEVGPDVRQEFRDQGLSTDVFSPGPGGEDSFYLDLYTANKDQAMESGVREDNILSLSTCTHCSPHLYSYRRDRDKRGRLLNFIGIKPI